MTTDRFRRATLFAAVPLVASALALVVAECAVRVAAPHFLNRNAARLITEHDPLLGWRKKSLATKTYRTPEYTATVTTNSHGLRGPEHSLAKPDRTYRILLLGDSFAEGYTTAFDSTAGAVLERLLDADGPRYEVINGGTAGYSTDQELLFFRETGRKYKPDLTVLMFYINDVWFNSRDRYWRGSKPFFLRRGDRLELANVPVPKPDRAGFARAGQERDKSRGMLLTIDAWLGRNSRLYGIAASTLRRSPRLSAFMESGVFRAIPDDWRPWKKEPDSVLAEAWMITETLLVRLNREAVESGGHLVVFYVPSRAGVYDGDWSAMKREYAIDDEGWSPMRDAEILREICFRASLDCIDTLQRFRVEATRLQSAGQRLYFRRDAHWNAAGNSVAGALMAEHVRTLRLSLSGQE